MWKETPNQITGGTVNGTTVGQPPEQSEKTASLQISAELQRLPVGQALEDRGVAKG